MFKAHSNYIIRNYQPRTNLTRAQTKRLDIDIFSIKFKRFLKEEEFKKDHHSKFSALTERERQILELVVTGCNNPCISKRLHISRCTVEQHRKNINRKLQIKNVADVFEYALAFNLL